MACQSKKSTHANSIKKKKNSDDDSLIPFSCFRFRVLKAINVYAGSQPCLTVALKHNTAIINVISNTCAFPIIKSNTVKLSTSLVSCLSE